MTSVRKKETTMPDIPDSNKTTDNTYDPSSDIVNIVMNSGEIIEVHTDPAYAHKVVEDALQGLKVMYLDIPEEFTEEYNQVVKLIKRQMKLYDRIFSHFEEWRLKDEENY
jgi:hypothetical protein